MEHADYKELLALEALGALGADESRRLAAHIESCAECPGELENLRETAALLAYAVAPAAPSPGLRARLLAAVREPGAAASGAGGAGSAGDVDVVSTRKPTRGDDAGREPVELSAWRLRAAPPAFRYGALAAALALAVLAAATALLWNRNNGLRAEMARLSDGLRASREESARRGEELARAAEIRDLMDSPEAVVSALGGTPAAANARGRLVYDRNTRRAVLFAYDLPPAPAGKAYQLWYIAGGKPLPGGVFTTDARGRAVMRDVAPAEARGASLFAVTLEPAGGVPVATGDKYLLSQSS